MGTFVYGVKLQPSLLHPNFQIILNLIKFQFPSTKDELK